MLPVVLSVITQTALTAKMKPEAKSGWKTPWTAEDIELLSSLAGDLPWPMVMPAFNRQRPHRTDAGLERQARRLRISKQSTGQFFTAGLIVALAKNVSHRMVNSWIKSGVKGDKLPARQFGRGSSYRFFIRRVDLRQFARRHPELFGGLPESQLLQLLDSERLAAEIAAMELPPPRRRAIPVECVETGRRYPSIAAAARTAYVTPQAMHRAVTSGGRANGCRWRRVSK